MTACFVPECLNDAPEGMTINGRPICEGHVDVLWQQVNEHPEAVMELTVEGEDANGRPFTVHFERDAADVDDFSDPAGG